jgi:hypothetical protein
MGNVDSKADLPTGLPSPQAETVNREQVIIYSVSKFCIDL